MDLMFVSIILGFFGLFVLFFKIRKEEKEIRGGGGSGCFAVGSDAKKRGGDRIDTHITVSGFFLHLCLYSCCGCLYVCMYS
jgi:hypothetical protein